MSAIPLRRPGAARRRRRRHLRVVADGPGAHPVLFGLAALVLAALIVLGAVSLSALAASSAVQARELSAEVAAAERRHGHLVAEVAGLEAPNRIRAAAEAAGMIPATQPQFLSPGRPLPADVGTVTPGDDDIKPLLTADGR